MPELQVRRRDALRSRLAGTGAQAALVTDSVNVRYLTGFTGSNAALLVTAGAGDLFGTDGRYTDQAAEQLPEVERLITRTLLSDLVSAAAVRGVAGLAVEKHVLTVDQYAAIQESAPTIDLVSLNRSVEQLRLRKDEAEVAALRTACEISTAALTELLAGPLRGRTECEIARDLEWRMYAGGAEAVGFDTIVASGPHSAVPHHSPTNREVRSGDLLKIDFGARYAGYHADCTRTVIVGRPAAAWQGEVYVVVAAAQSAGTAAARAGAELAGIDEVARTVIAEAGYADQFTHGLGHGVGLRIHEDPYLGASAVGKVEAGSSVTVEPGVYLPGRGGVRIEDTMIVGAQEPELLTLATKELLIVG